MPGVVVTTGVRTSPSSTAVAPASTFFVVGTSQRGPVGYSGADPSASSYTPSAKLVTSLADFETYFGTYNSAYTLHQHVKTFFEEGGVRAYVSRVVGASATSGSLAMSGGGAMTLTAANPGSWSSNVTVTVTATSGPFAVKIFYSGSLVYTTGTVTTVGEAVTKINNSTVAAAYVRATLVTAGANLTTAYTAAPLSAGVDGATPSAALLIEGLDVFADSYGAGAVAIPGQTTSTAYDALVAHAKDHNRIALLAIPQTDTVTDAVDEAANYASVDGAEYAAFYYPFITVPGDGGTTLTISPESYVAAKRAVAHAQIGPWQAGAGLLSAASYVTGVDKTVNKTDGDTLDAGRVNAIRIIQGSVRVYGARSASDDDDNWRYITYRDMLNYIVTEAERRLEDLVFSPIDGRQSVFGRVEARLIGLLDPLRSLGGLYEAFNADGELVDPGYSVQVTDALNPVSQLATGLIKARVGVRVSSVGDQIEVEVLKSNLTSSVV